MKWEISRHGDRRRKHMLPIYTLESFFFVCLSESHFFIIHFSLEYQPCRQSMVKKKKMSFMDQQQYDIR